MQCDATNAIHISGTELETRETALAFVAQVYAEINIIWPVKKQAMPAKSFTNSPETKP